MRTQLFVIVVMLLVLGGSTSECALVVNEININSGGPGDGVDGLNGEWIELFNNGATALNASGYIISDGDWTIVLPTTTTIGAGVYYLIGFANTAEDLGGTPTFDLNLNTASSTLIGGNPLTLTNGGEFLGVFDPTGTLVDGLVWGSPSAGNTPGPGGDTAAPLPSGNPLGANLTIPGSGWTTTSLVPGNGISLARNINGGGTWVSSSTLNGNTAGASNIAVPEPTGLAMLGVSLVSGLSFWRRKKESPLG